MPASLLFLLRWYAATGDTAALAMVEKTLAAMARGGIHDHVGFGFCRYATDRRWLVPHFEKCLRQRPAALATRCLQATGHASGPICPQNPPYMLAAIPRALLHRRGSDAAGVEAALYLDAGSLRLLGPTAGMVRL